MPKPLVTVICITYNHVQFIRSCLESLVSQQCDFSYEIIVHDDASIDGTQDIIKEFYHNYPDLIIPILQKENQWSKKPGLLDVFVEKSLFSGTYIALCEGDDFWVEPDKLQKQVEILENHPECNMTCSSYLLIDNNEKRDIIQKKWETENYEDKSGRVFELADLNHSFFIKTSTAMFRNFSELYIQLDKFEFCLDIHIFYLLLKSGKGYYSKDVMAGYNRHPGGTYSGSTQHEILLTQYFILKDIYEKDGDDFVRKKYLELAFLMINLKVSGLMPGRKIKQKAIRYRNPGIVKLVKTIKPVLETKTERETFYKSFVPMQAKAIRQKMKQLFQ